ncbi:MAG TPA: TonB-dependent receptor plug domain-containing protein [Gemmatimonadales bacterium]|nr:TonB-dependent receptor plug domain-containing protein [Gemmatimonadales bacterium]
MPAALIVSVLGCSHNPRPTVTSLKPRRAMGLTAEDIARSPGVPIEQLIAARVPGIMIGRASDGRMVMFVRGQSTLGEPQEPLYVVNGVPLGSAANISAINRMDIASIEVLRDAASTAMYGLQGSAGVILIKTKGF